MVGTKTISLINAMVFTETGIYSPGYITFKGEKITDIGLYQEGITFPHQTIRLNPSDYVIPGMIDIHIHGASGSDTMDATEEAISVIASSIPREGTTSFLATTITQHEDHINAALKNVANYKSTANGPGKSELLGVHLEGPFISNKQAGAQPAQHIKQPSVEMMGKWIRLSDNHIRIVTLSPETDIEFELIKYLHTHSLIASIGHSDATYEVVKQSIEYGVKHATHLFNAMKGMHHRELGVVGGVLIHDEILTELIVDGYHFTPEMARITYKQKQKDKIILISDSIRAKFLEDGIYELAGQEVIVKNGTAKLKDGRLAGSILKMNDAFRNMINFSGCSILDCISMTSSNAAKSLNVFHRKGSLEKGKDADIVVLNEKYEVCLTFCRGELAFTNLLK